MKVLLLPLLIYGLCITKAYGQEVKEVYPKQASIEHNDAVQSFSKDFSLTLPGFPSSSNFQTPGEFNNIASINVLGSENITVLNQMGYDITGLINVLGNQNRATLSQEGSDLHSVLNIEGDYNNLDLIQQGTGLQNYLQIHGSGSNFDVYQNNMGTEFSQTGMGSIPLSIQHTGRTVPIIIENN